MNRCNLCGTEKSLTQHHIRNPNNGKCYGKTLLCDRCHKGVNKFLKYKPYKKTNNRPTKTSYMYEVDVLDFKLK